MFFKVCNKIKLLWVSPGSLKCPSCGFFSFHPYHIVLSFSHFQQMSNTVLLDCQRQVQWSRWDTGQHWHWQHCSHSRGSSLCPLLPQDDQHGDPLCPLQFTSTSEVSSVDQHGGSLLLPLNKLEFNGVEETLANIGVRRVEVKKDGLLFIMKRIYLVFCWMKIAIQIEAENRWSFAFK